MPAMDVKEAKMKEQDFRKELATQKREMQIQVIKQVHPVYETFNFKPCSDEKISEMYRVLVEQRVKDEQKQSD
jgi:hypothetical protein